MIYYKQAEDCIIKYNVTYDKTLLEQIRKDLIDRCSIKKHIIKKDTINPKDGYINPLAEKISKLKKTDTGKTIDDKVVYEFDYIYTCYPKLVLIIIGLLNENESSLKELFDYEIEHPIDFDKQIERKKDEIKENFLEYTEDDFNRVKRDLFLLFENRKLNEKSTSTMECYYKLLTSLNYEEVDKVSYDMIDKYNLFFEGYEYDFQKRLVRKKDE